jgi:hypothetical protein
VCVRKIISILRKNIFHARFLADIERLLKELYPADLYQYLRRCAFLYTRMVSNNLSPRVMAYLDDLLHDGVDGDRQLRANLRRVG